MQYVRLHHQFHNFTTIDGLTDIYIYNASLMYVQTFISKKATAAPDGVRH